MPLSRKAYVRIRLTPSAMEIRFERVGPEAAFDKLLDSFHQAVPEARFSRQTGWQVVPMSCISQALHFCFTHFAPVNVHIQTENIIQPGARQLALPLL